MGSRATASKKNLFVDPQSLLIVGDRRSARVHAFGDPTHSENRFTDYRPVNGVLFPFLFVEVEIATRNRLNRFAL
jgi:hypothetical protein